MDPGTETKRVGGRVRTLGGLIAVAAIAAAFGAGSNAQGPIASPSIGSNANPTIATHLASQPGQPHQLIVIDSEQRAVAVYQIDVQSGEISLASVRNITWDLKLPEHNTNKPLPKDIRNALQEAR